MHSRILDFLFRLKAKYHGGQDPALHDLHEFLDDYEYEIDEQTRADLMTAEFTEAYRRTLTSAGDQVFDHWTRSVRRKEDLLVFQDDVRRALGSGTDRTERALARLGKQGRGHIVTDLWNGFTVRAWVVDNFVWLQALNLAACALICLAGARFVIAAVTLFLLVNLTLYLLANRHIARVAGSINYFMGLCRCVEKALRYGELPIGLAQPDYRTFRRVAWCSVLFKEGVGGPQSGDPLAMLVDNLRVFLCLEIIAFRLTRRHLLRHSDELRAMVYYAGYLDCVLSCKALARDGGLTFARLTDDSFIDFTDMRHPLIDGAVGQSRRVGRGIVATGMNMAGKTSFMKSLGLNQAFATGFGLAFASSYETGIFRIVSSLRIDDNLLSRRSRYYAEAYRLAEMMRLAADAPSLCLIDEILSGTNSDERIRGATEILRRFSAGRGSIVVAATHDTAIAESLRDAYDLIYFDGERRGDRLVFDYRVKDGVVSRRNGLDILRILGIEVEAR